MPARTTLAPSVVIRRALVPALLLVVVAAGPACEQSTDGATATTDPVAGTTEALDDAPVDATTDGFDPVAYPPICDLTDRTAPLGVDPSERTVEYTPPEARVVGEPVARGDVTGDDVDEVVVLVDCGSVDDPLGVVAFVWSDGETGPVPLGALRAEGSELRNATSAAIEDEGIVVDESSYLPDDDPCCPTGTSQTRWVWDGERFVVDRGADEIVPATGLITTSSVGPFHLGMSIDELQPLGIRLGAIVQGCGIDQTWEVEGEPDGVDLIVDDAGTLLAVMVTSPVYSTAANISVDSTLADLTAAYPTAERTDFGPGAGSQHAEVASDGSSGMFFSTLDDDVTLIVVAHGAEAFLDVC